MTRTLFCSIVACCLSGLAAQGFPAPREDRPTNAEMIVGTWEYMDVDMKGRFIEFHENGNVRTFRAAGDDETMSGHYEVIGTTLRGREKVTDDWTITQIKSIMFERCIIQDGERTFVLRRN